jgi:serine O-acetyltransferase
VVVGAGAKLLGPIVIGKGVRVGANSVVTAPVPAGKTVVGIPGKVVRSLCAAERQANGGIDLNHHLMPDPVAEAISCLLERILRLEEQLGTHGCLPGGVSAEDECKACDAVQVCEPAGVATPTAGN